MPTLTEFLPDESTFFLITPAPGIDAHGLEIAFRKDGSAMGMRVRGQEEIGFALSGDAARALVALISDQLPGGRYIPAIPLAPAESGYLYDPNPLGNEGEAEGAAPEAQAEEVEDAREGLTVDQGILSAAPRVEPGEE